VHELGHLALAVNGVPVGPKTEAWCNDFAGQVLMPAERLDAVFQEPTGPLLNRVQHVSRTFVVTPLAAAVRIGRAGLVPKDEAGACIAHIQARGEGAESKPGRRSDYYLNQIAGFGPGFIRLVFSALDSQAVTYPTASALLEGVKVNNFEKLRTQLERRAALE